MNYIHLYVVQKVVVLYCITVCFIKYLVFVAMHWHVLMFLSLKYKTGLELRGMHAHSFNDAITDLILIYVTAMMVCGAINYHNCTAST